MNQMTTTTKSLHIYYWQVHLIKNSYTLSIISIHFINDIWPSDLHEVKFIWIDDRNVVNKVQVINRVSTEYFVFIYFAFHFIILSFRPVIFKLSSILVYLRSYSACTQHGCTQLTRRYQYNKYSLLICLLYI